jgi:type VI secretion system protein ImpE
VEAKERFREGDLAGAIAAQVEHVRSHPADRSARAYLFGLYCFAGDLERAERQLDAMSEGDPRVDAGILVYRHLLLSEATRQDTFRGKAKPVLPPDTPLDVEKRLAALEASARGNSQEAERLLEEAGEASPLLSGKLNGEAFDGIREADDLLASLLEVYAGGHYL